jgi:hypothetical protein
MKKHTLAVIMVILSLPVYLFSQNQPDSVNSFSGMKFHSDFEKQALNSYILNKKDTFNLFLAIDETMTKEIADGYRAVLNKVFAELYKQKIETKNADRKVRMTYSLVRNQFLLKYSDNEYFPMIFKDGTYNCVTGALLFSFIFDQLKIPYKVMVSSNYVFLIANPGKKSIVIDVLNPSVQKSIFNEDVQQQFVDSWLSSRLISDAEYKNKSVAEIFITKNNGLKDLNTSYLPGFQYYNKAVTKVAEKDYDKAYELAQKAYYFFPDKKVKTLFNSILNNKLLNSEYNKIEDIDLLVQYAKLESTNINMITMLFNSMVSKNLKYTDRSKNLDSYYQRFISQISNKEILNEIGFNYYFARANRSMIDQLNSTNTSSYSSYCTRQALKFKPNHREAIRLFESDLGSDIMGREMNVAYLDSLNSFEKELNNADISTLLVDYKNQIYLKIALKAFRSRNFADGEKYMILFENNFRLPIKKTQMRYTIENAYYEYASYYARINNKEKVDMIIDKGLKLIPNSNMIQSARDNYPKKANAKMQVVKG